MASAWTVQLAKVLNVFDGDRFVAGHLAMRVDTLNSSQMNHRIEQHRCVATGKYKAIAVRPFWVHRIITKRPGPQLKRNGS